jgi:transposase
MPQYVERLLSTIETLHAQIADADAELEQLAAQDPICQRLMSVPGIGPVTSMRFVAAIDDVTRFHDAHSVQSFLGLTPGEHSSSNRQQRTGITKAGPAHQYAVLSRKRPGAFDAPARTTRSRFGLCRSS